MKDHDEWFASEEIEEQIERYLSVPEPASANEQLLQDLEHLTRDDTRRLAEIRARLVEYEAGKMKRVPFPLQQRQPRSVQAQGRRERRQARRPATLLVRMLSGLVAVLIIGSMLFEFAHLGTSVKQNRVAHPHPTSVATPPVAQNMQGMSVFLLDATSGKVLLEENSHVRRPVATLTTIMIAVVAIEDADLQQDVTVQQATLDVVPAGANRAGLHAGDRLSLQALLYGLLFSGGDDAALVIAQNVGGSSQRFVALMNEEAHQLQLNDTSFSEPYAVPTLENYSSAADLARLGAYALQLTPFAQIAMDKDYTLAETAEHHSYHWHSTNSLLSAYAGMNGIMLGSDATAGACAVFSAQQHNRVLVGVELHAQADAELASDVTKLLKQGFSSQGTGR